MKKIEFYFLHPVFTVEEFSLACFKGKLRKSALSALYLAEQAGKIRRLKRGLYQSLPAGMKDFPPPNPLLVASRMSTDAILSHHSAFEALGASHSEFMGFATYWTEVGRPLMTIEKVQYQPLVQPSILRGKKKTEWGVEKLSLQNLLVRVTSRERTFVDGIQSPHWVGGWEEFCHCVNNFSHLNLDKVLAYLKLRDSPSFYSRVGFFLAENQERFFVSDKFLKRLYAKKSSAPIPLVVRQANKGKHNKTWNVMVPPRIITRISELS